MPRLKVLGNYANQTAVFPKGSVIEVTEAEAEFLFRDAPGCFEPVVDKPVVKEVPAPPVDKMVTNAPAKKAGK